MQNRGIIIIIIIIIPIITIIMIKVLLQGTEGVGGLAWASIDDTCRLNYNVRMEVIIIVTLILYRKKLWRGVGGGGSLFLDKSVTKKGFCCREQT